MEKIKYIICILLLFLLSSCADLNEPTDESSELSSASYSETGFVAGEATYMEESDQKFKKSLYDSGVQDYLSSLMLNKTFLLLDDKYEYVQIIDLNNDNIPEIIFECSSYSVYEEHYCYVFSKNENGVFAVPHDNCEDDYTLYSYYGSMVKAYYDENDRSIFIADYLYGGIDTAEFGKKYIFFDGEKIYEKNLYTSTFKIGEQQYRFFDSELTSKNKCVEYDKYISLLRENKVFSKQVNLFDENHMAINKEDVYVIIADLLSEFNSTMPS